MWDTHVREFTMDANGAHTPSAADHAEAAAATIVADLEQHAEALARQAHDAADTDRVYRTGVG